MLWGVFLHAATVGDFGVITAVVGFSDAFRMALFFTISGYLGALLLDRQSPAVFLTGRLRNLLVPLLFGLLVLNPPALWLVYTHFNSGPASASLVLEASFGRLPGVDGPIVWHLHLWFLISLITYVLVAPVAMAAIRAVLDSADRRPDTFRLPRAAAPWVAVLLMALIGVALRVVVASVEAAVGGIPWLVRATAVYLPFYLFGMVLFKSPALRAAVIRPSWGLGLVVIAMYAASKQLPIDGPVGSAFVIFALAAVRTWMAIMLIHLGERLISRRNGVTDLFSRAIYTVYLLHYLVIYFLAVMLTDGPEVSSPAVYAGLVAGATVFGLLFHSLAVSRSRTLTYLLNGRLWRPKAALP